MATNTILGSAFDDVLATTIAADKVTAVAGNDIILVAAATDHFAGESLDGGLGMDQLWFAGGGALTLLASTLGIESVRIADAVGNSNDTVAGDINAAAVTPLPAPVTVPPIFTLGGNDGVNSLTGTAGRDLIIGNGGLDTIAGGLGADRVVMRVEAADVDQINAGLLTELNTLALVGVATGVANINLNVLAGVDELLDFGGAADTMSQSGFTNVDGSGLTDFGVQVTASAAKNVLVGSDYDDVFVYLLPGHITGDTISGGTGTTMGGATGNDVVRFASTTNGQILLLPKGLAVEEAQVADAAGLTTGITKLGLSAIGLTTGISLVGNDGANILTGGLGADTINGNGNSTTVGFTGGDSLAGGAGNDVYFIDDPADWKPLDQIIDSAGLDDRIAFNSTIPGAQLVLGINVKGVEAIYLTDLKFDPTTATTAKVDATATSKGFFFFGNNGYNELLGGKYNDTFVLKVDQAALDKIDAGNANSTEANTLKLIGTAASSVYVDLSAAADADMMAVNALPGDTAMQSDFRNVDAKDLGSQGVVVTLSAFANKIVGSSSADIIAAMTKTALTTADSIDGGAGNDILRFSLAAASTMASANTLTVVNANVLNVETVDIADLTGSFSGTANLGINAAAVSTKLHLLGNYGDNKILGGLGDDTLIGSQGSDSLTGGSGNDEFHVEFGVDHTALDSISGGLGIDVLRFISVQPGDLLTLNKYMSGIESVRISDKDGNTDGLTTAGIDGSSAPGALQLFGDSGDNALTGSKYGDLIEGGAGNDTINGGLGNDTIVLSAVLGESDQIAAAAGGIPIATDKNLLALKGDWWAGDYIYINLGNAADQMGDDPFTVPVENLDGRTQTGLWNVDASLLAGPEGLGVYVIGSTRPENFIGSNKHDVFDGGGGSGVDNFDGRGEGDAYILHSTTIGTNVYNDTGNTTGDHLIFEVVGSSANISILPSWKIDGIDGADVGFTAGNMSLNASTMTRGFSLGGNAGNNNLTGTDFGESIFDDGNGITGGSDLMKGGGGSDDYVITSKWEPFILNVQAGDRIQDLGTFGFDEVYYAFNGVDVMVVNANVSGIERFTVSSAGLADFDAPQPPVGSAYIRDIRSLNDAGIDISAYGAGPTGYMLSGSFGDNSLVGSRFADTIIGWMGADTVVGMAGADTIYMQVGDEEFVDLGDGIWDYDQIYGDSVGGGLNINKLVLVGTAPSQIFVDLSVAYGVDQVQIAGDTMLPGSADTLMQTGFKDVDAAGVTKPVDFTLNHPSDPFGVVVIGAPGANVFKGSSFDDVFVVRAIADHVVAGESIIGGGGNDALYFDITTPGGILALSPFRLSSIEIADLSDATGDHSSTIAGGLDASTMVFGMKLGGNAGANSILGGSGADTLNGDVGIDTVAGGADTLNGGLGNDMYIVDDGADVVPGDVISEALLGGTADTLRFISTVTGDTLVMTSGMANLEIVEITDDQGRIEGDPNGTPPAPPVDLNLDASAVPDALDIRGNDALNVLTGTAFADTITGNGGLDTIVAGGGADLIRVEMAVGNPGNYLLMDTFDDIDAGLITEGNTLVLVGPLLADNDTSTGGMTFDLSSGVDQLVAVAGAPDIGVVTGITHLDASLLVNAHVEVTGSVEGNLIIGTLKDDLFYTASPFVAGDSIDGGLGFDSLDFTSTNSGDTLVLGGRLANVELVTLSGAANLGLNAAGVAAGLVIDAGNAGSDTITGTSFADTITVDVAADDVISAGAVAELNRLILKGAAAGAISVDLSVTALNADQITGIAGIQSGFSFVDASGVTGFDVNVVGSAADNRIGVNAAQTSAVNGGAGIDTLLLGGTAAGTVVIDLSSGVDQVTSMANIQVGFENVEASLLLGAGIDVTGSAGANRIFGSSQADTISGGMGADTIDVFLNGVFDQIDAGAPYEGNLLLLHGDAAAIVHVDLSVAPGADQMPDDAADTQTGFQHIDASAVFDFGIDARGNGLNNSITGSLMADTIYGGGGSDRIALGGGKDGDNIADVVVYERPGDGVKGAAAIYSFDHITDFKSGQDKFSFAADFHDGAFNLDDIDHNNAFKFVNNLKADFTKTDEALLITSDKSGLTTELALTGGSFASVAGAINKIGVVAALGDDGLILVQAVGGTATVPIERTGIYYYQESDGIVNKVSAGELTLLGIVETKITESDVNFI